MTALRSVFKSLRCDPEPESSVIVSDSDRDLETVAPQDKEPQDEPPSKENTMDTMNALTYMKKYIDAQMSGEDLPESNLADLVTEQEKAAMVDTPFGRMNEMLGLVAGFEEEDEEEEDDGMPMLVRMTKKQLDILEITHKKFLFGLYQAKLSNLAEVYQFACDEEDFDAFMDDFPQA